MTEMKDKEDFSLLRFEGANGPVFFVVSDNYGDEGESDDSLQSSKEYLYESHSCPTNWLRNVVAVIDETGDEDPHGFLKHVRTVRVAKDFEPENGSWTELFPEAAPGYIPPNAPHEPVDDQFYEPAELTKEQQQEVAKMRAMIDQVRPPPAPGLSAISVARAFEVMLPAHKCGLFITHNEHKDYYKTVAQTLEDVDDPHYDWVSPVEMQKAVETDEMWVLQWYPDTPIGFNCIAAASLPALAQWLQDNGLAFGS